MALLGERTSGARAAGTPRRAPERGPARAPERGRGPSGPLPGLALAAAGVGAAWGVHLLVPAVPMLSAAIVLGIVAAHLPGARPFVRGTGRPGLTLAGRRLMRAGVVLLGLQLSLSDVAGLGWSTVVMVVAVVAATFCGTVWLGRRLGLPGDQPLLVATGYAICGASAIGAVSEVRRSDERDVATSVALVTLCGTLAIGVLPLLQGPLALNDVQFGRWVGAGVHDVGQVVATAQTAGSAALGEAVLVKLMRVALLAPLVAVLGALAVTTVRTARGALAIRGAAVRGGAVRGAAGRGGDGGTGRRARPARGARPPLVPLFVLGFLAMVVLRTALPVPVGVLGPSALTGPHRRPRRGARPGRLDGHRGGLLRRSAADHGVGHPTRGAGPCGGRGDRTAPLRAPARAAWRRERTARTPRAM